MTFEFMTQATFTRDPHSHLSIYSCNDLIAEIIERVRLPVVPPFRPQVSYLDECPSQCPEFVISVMTESWDELPEARPTFRTIRERLKPLKEGM